jgi:hypothetical protein
MIGSRFIGIRPPYAGKERVFAKYTRACETGGSSLSFPVFQQSTTDHGQIPHIQVGVVSNDPAVADADLRGFVGNEDSVLQPRPV